MSSNRICLRIRDPKRTLRQAVAWVTVLHQHRHPSPVTVLSETMQSCGPCASDLEAGYIVLHDSVRWINEQLYLGGFALNAFLLRIETNHEQLQRSVRARIATFSPQVAERMRNCYAMLKMFSATEVELKS